MDKILIYLKKTILNSTSKMSIVIVYSDNIVLYLKYSTQITLYFI